MHFNEANRTVSLSVHDLVNSAMGVEAMLWGGQPRAEMGSDVHAAYFASQQGGGFRKEVSVRWEGDWHDYHVLVEGRADACRETAAGVIVEEVKSTLRHGALMSDLRLNRAHAEQCGFYCLLLARAGVRVAGGLVKYISVSDGSAREFDIEFQLPDYEALFDERLATLIADRREEERLARIRAHYAGQMAFPFPEIRGGQQTMIDDVEGAARDGRIILCSAPTGIGKTAAALFPALRQTLLQNRKLFFLTAKVSQQDLALDTLRRLVRPGAEICAMQLSARERSCPMEELNCMVGECPFTEGFEYRLRRSGLIATLRSQGVVDSGFIRRAAMKQELCPFEVSLALAHHASVIVADYNYVFDPGVALKRFFDDPADEQRFLMVVDEAHNLPARAVGYYSPELDIVAMTGLAAEARHAAVEIYRDAGSLLTDVCDYFRRTMAALEGERGESPQYAEEPDRQFFARILSKLEPLLYDYFVYLAGGGQRPPAFAPTREKGRKRLLDPLLDVLFAIRDFGECCALDPPLFATIWYRDERLKMLCLDPAPLLQERIRMFHAAILMSATLTPFDFYGQMLGVEAPGTLNLELPSPFPRENRLFLTVKTVDTTFRRRSRDARMVARIMAETIQLRRGNYLAFFPSFAYRDEVLAHLPEDGFRVIRQEPAMPTERILKELTENTGDTILLCGVMGGVFSEGVDYPGHLAIGAFVVGPGLPQVSPEQELVKEYFEKHRGAGFEFAYVNPGMNRVVQAGGRVIRSGTDRGFIMLLCRRFTNKLYFGKFPQYWQEEITVTEDPVAAVREFWKRVEPGA